MENEQKKKLKLQKRDIIKLRWHVKQPDFRYHYEKLMREPPGATNPILLEALANVLFSNAAEKIEELEALEENASKGGHATAERKREENEVRNNKIIEQAKYLLRKHPRRGLASLLKRKPGNSEAAKLSIRQINNILTKADI